MADETVPTSGHNPGGFDLMRVIRENWPVIVFAIGLVVYQVQNDRDTKNDLVGIKADIVSVKSTAADRSKVADEFYEKFSDQNLASRVTSLERQMEQMMRVFERGIEQQATSTESLRKDVAGAVVQLGIISSKVDDLREGRAQKTIFPISAEKGG